MIKFIRIFLCLFLVVSLAGCLSNPLSRFKSAEAKVAAAKDKKEKVEEKIESKAVPYTFGAQYALGKEENPSKPVVVAKSFLDSSLTITGPPSFKDSLEFKQIVDGLLATNQLVIKNAEKQLAAKNQEVIQLQGQVISLGEKLTIVEKIRDDISLKNSEMANRWNMLKRIFWWGVWIAGFFIASQILSQILPAPYGSIFGVLSLLGGLFIKIVSSVIPKTKEIGGVVAKSTYDSTNETLKQIILGVQKARQDESVAEKLDLELKAALDVSSKRKVTDLKRELGDI